MYMSCVSFSPLSNFTKVYNYPCLIAVATMNTFQSQGLSSRKSDPKFSCRPLGCIPVTEALRLDGSWIPSCTTQEVLTLQCRETLPQQATPQLKGVLQKLSL